jgi:hypothetical protein
MRHPTQSRVFFHNRPKGIILAICGIYRSICPVTPYPGEPTSGTVNKGRLGDKLPDGEDYRPHEVEEISRRLWLAHCAGKKKS